MFIWRRTAAGITICQGSAADGSRAVLGQTQRGCRACVRLGEVCGNGWAHGVLALSQLIEDRLDVLSQLRLSELEEAIARAGQNSSGVVAVAGHYQQLPKAEPDVTDAIQPPQS
jgi:hypothetical protein